MGRVVFALVAFAATALVGARFHRARADTAELLLRAQGHGARVILDAPELHDLDGWKVDWERAKDGQLARFLPEVAGALAVYPPGTLERARIKKVLVCRGVRTGGKGCGGLALPEHDAVLVSLEPRYEPWFVRLTVHHELFHVIDARARDAAFESAWADLNADGFRGYLGSGWEALDVPGYGGELSREPGFLTNYSRAAPTEDRAELFAHAIVDPVGTRARAARDPIVRRKLRLVAELAAREPALLGPAFWERL